MRGEGGTRVSETEAECGKTGIILAIQPVTRITTKPEHVTNKSTNIEIVL